MNRLRELREAKGLNQQGLGMKLNMSQPSISYYETGERKPDLDALIIISDYFNVSIDYLIGCSDIKRTNLHNHGTAGDINFYNDYLRLTPSQKEHVSIYMQGLLAESKN
ncbi:MAG: helix-turn-helix domain-containing protein [Defluviitaleaceae bacterium]|nr:helix-turn-helix domain-containing protein [Defluviitaleaceae bacterium]